MNLSLTLHTADALNYGNFVQSAYDVYKALPKVLSPTIEQYPDFPSGYTLRYNIHMADNILTKGNVVYYGFIAESIANPKNLVIAIRGTEGFLEWLDDLGVAPVPLTFGNGGGLVTTGFLALYNSLMVTLPGQPGSAIKLSATAKAPANDDFNIDDSDSLTVAGHSLGGALATLYGLHLASEDKNITIYTYASPCVGNDDFVSYYSSLITASYRIYNQPDIVPKALTFLGYTHVPSGSELNSKTDTHIKKSIGCFHSLATYLYLLGAPVGTLKDCTA